MGKKSKRRVRAGKAKKQNSQQQQQQQQRTPSSTSPSLSPSVAPSQAASLQQNIPESDDPEGWISIALERLLFLLSFPPGEIESDEERLTSMVLFRACFTENVKEVRKNEEFQQKVWKVLKRIRRSDMEPVFVRFSVLELSCRMSILSFGGAHFDDTAFYFDRANDVLKDTSNQEKQKLVDLSGTGKDLVSVGDLMKDGRDGLYDLISNLNKAFVYGSWVPDGDGGYTDKSISVVDGWQCDGCGKDRHDLGVFTFKVCGSCKLTYYCSTECQVHAWNEQGHKRVCRKKGIFKPGDLARVAKSVDGIKTGSTVRVVKRIVNVRASDSSDDKYWNVKTEGEIELSATMSSKNLKRIPPSKWNLWDRNELNNIGKMLMERDEMIKEQDEASEFGDQEVDFVPSLVNSDQAPDSDDESV